MSAPDDERGLDQASDLQLVGRLWPFVRPDAWTLGLALLLTPAIAALNLAQPLLLKEAIDGHLVPEVLDGLDQVALLYLAAVLGAYITEAAYSLALSWGGERTILRLRKALYSHALTLAQRFFDRQPAGKLLTRVTNDVEALGESIASGVVSIVLDLLLILGIGGTMLWLNWQLSLLLLLLAPPLLGSIEWMRLQLKRLFVVVREAQADLNAFLAERVDGAQVIQLQGAQPWAEAEFARRSRTFTEANKSANIYDAAMFAVVDGASRIFVAVVLWGGTGLAADALAAVGIEGAAPPLSVGLLVAFMDYLDRLFRPLRELSGKITILQRAATSLQRLFWLLDVNDKVEPGTVAAPRLRGALVLEGVRFRYRPDQPEVLKGVDLRVEPGQSVAVVGATGSGKTTLMRLLDRSYDGYTGSVRVDGHELRALDPAGLRRQLVAVRQDIQLFAQPLSFNVDLGNSEISVTAREAAAAAANATGFVERLGWGHVLRERGADLSVGEGQLLTFARALAHDPVLVILDEATASVDSLTEGLVQEAIGRILEGRTVLIVAHRLSTVQRADRIAVMADGQVVEFGAHAELLALGGRYAALVAAGQVALGEGSPAQAQVQAGAPDVG
ncbi:MAG: ABC transporter ATP-binding protein [Deltaproteobacteria bacterium]|nr:ABC transporter ATP-binding protein [Deltaproteobacteria bacterium]